MLKKLFLAFAILTSSILGQDVIFTKKYYRYTPVTDTVINITSTSATFVGNDGRIKSNKLDTLATRKAPRREMIWWSDADSLVTLDNNLRILGNGWYINDDNYDTIYVNSGMFGYPARFEFNRDVTINYSMEIVGYVSGTVYLGWPDEENNYIDTLNANGIFTGTCTTADGYLIFSASGNAEMGITSFDFDILEDTASGKITNITGLQPRTTYKYRYSMFVKTEGGDRSLDYHQGEIKSFTTLDDPILDLPIGIYIVTPEGKYWTTENGDYATLE